MAWHQNGQELTIYRASLMSNINCRQCRHYFVTWEPHAPHGCRLIGFKSRLMPSTLVYQNSGQQCRSYSPKPRLPRKN